MISLYNTLRESLLGGFDEIEASMDPKKEIEQFIKDNYRINRRIKISISDRPNKNGKYEVSYGSVEVKNRHITFLTNNLFEWGEIRGYFNCSGCKSLTSLEGTPKEVEGNFDCSDCSSLTSLEGAPGKVFGYFSCSGCTSLTSLEGAPEEVKGSFDCSNCHSLTSLKGAPKEVGQNFICNGCKQDFTEDDVRKICNVKNRIHV